MSISFGNEDKSWAQYGLIQSPVLFKNEETPYKAIIRNGELIKILGRGYELFPNEEAIQMANSAAELTALHPFPIKAYGLKTEDNILYNKEETKIRAIYTYDNVEKVDGDKVNLGVNIFNSIDGSSSFGCGLFTFRGICSNGVIFGYEKLFSMKRMHTIGLNKILDDMKNRMITVMEKGQDVIETYRHMAEQKLTKQLIAKILKSRLSKRVLPDYITEEEATLPDLTQWDLYNDITEQIWHNEKAGLHTKTFQFDTLHRVMPIQVRRI